jgi:hypothetical protein
VDSSHNKDLVAERERRFELSMVFSVLNHSKWQSETGPKCIAFQGVRKRVSTDGCAAPAGNSSDIPEAWLAGISESKNCCNIKDLVAERETGR